MMEIKKETQLHALLVFIKFLLRNRRREASSMHRQNLKIFSLSLCFFFFFFFGGFFWECKSLHALNVFIRVWLRKNDEYRPIQLQNYSKASSITQTIYLEKVNKKR